MIQKWSYFLFYTIVEMEGLPPELCMIISRYVSNPLFCITIKSKHSNFIPSYVLASSENKAIMLATKKRLTLDDAIHRFCSQFIKGRISDDKFANFTIMCADLAKLPTSYIYGPSKIQKDRLRRKVTEIMNKVIEDNQEEFLNEFKENFIISQVDVSQQKALT